LISGILCCFSAYCQTPSYFEKFVRPFQAGDLDKAEKALQEWDLADSNDPELYVAYFNFFTEKGLQKDSTKLDIKYANQALGYISEGINRFPTRIDMRIAKLYMLERIKNYPAVTNEVIKMIETSVKIDNQWKGEGFMLIQEPYEVFRGAVYEFQNRLLDQQNANLDKDVLKISEIMIKYYPKNVNSYVCISSVYLATDEYDKSLQALLKACDYEPNNVSLLYKTGYVFKLKGDKANARKMFNLTIESATRNDEIYKKAAQKQLGEMS